MVRFGQRAARVVVEAPGRTARTSCRSASRPGSRSGCASTGPTVERLLEVTERPLVSVFLPDRLELVKGAPALRRAHLDQFVAALWPARAATRRAYAQALAQRNALIARIRAGAGRRESLTSWDMQLARARDRADGATAGRRRRRCRAASRPARRARTGRRAEGRLPPALACRRRGRSSRRSSAERTDADLERGFTGHGPHRDDLALAREGRELRAYGSQGQQRLALLALLLAEREAIAPARGAAADAAR